MEPFVITWITMFILALTFDQPKTTVVLDDSDGVKSAVIIKSAKGELILDEPYQVATLSSNQSPQIQKKLTKSEVEKKYKNVSEALPQKPVQIMLYFKSGSSELTSESEAKLPDIIKTIKQRVPCYVNIIGHADRQGSEEVNIKISLNRASKINEWLLEQKLPIQSIRVESYGESDPLVKTKDGVAESKNRRVEVMIR